MSGSTGNGGRPAPDHGDLPLLDYDHLPIGTLRDRIRTLDGAGVRQLLDYEHEHGHRPHVVEVLRARLAELDAGAAPSAGSPLGQEPETTSATRPDPVSPRTAAQPGPPPPHGVPTNRRKR